MGNLMEIKKEDNKLIKTLFIIFLIFLIFYMSKESGYYEYRVYKKTKQIENKINEFEDDIELNENLSNKDYIDEEAIDYSSTLSNIGYKISNFTEELLNKSLKKTFKILEKLF